jgi:CheY-like chemotaxis protein
VAAASEGEGQGATFTISLPLAALPALSEDALRPATPADATTYDISLAGIRVLLVEDEPDAAEFVKRLLEQQGADVLVATVAREALQMLASAPADILISDIGLPDMDGFEMMERIRQQDAANGGGIPAVALTAFARSEDRTRALRAGYQAHLTKPVDSNELVATVASFADLVNTRRSGGTNARR